MKIGFDNALYVKKQSQAILERINSFGGKLYLEFGGKLFDDYHASRVLPGFDVNVKVKLLQKLKDKAELIMAVNAADLQKNKIRADMGIDYGHDVMRTIDNIRSLGIFVGSIVITQYEGQQAADLFKKKLELRGEKVYIHTRTKGYPTDVNTIVSDEGYGMNPYIVTERPLVVVTAPGPGSGKMATCLCQLYHESKRGVKAGYAKFETFPIWNIPLKHPVNVAYEAATADLKDVNMIDHFHLEAYGVKTVNYNRDIEVFPVVKAILTRILGECKYQSPTDMGVNMAGFGIVDDEIVKAAAKQEIIRRYYQTLCYYKQGNAEMDTIKKLEFLMSELGLSLDDRKVVAPALAKAQKCGKQVVALELPDGQIVTGKTTDDLEAASTALLNGIKVLAGIADPIKLIAPAVIRPMVNLKKKTYKERHYQLNPSEVLMALVVSQTNNHAAELAVQHLKDLKGCEAHSTCILSAADEKLFKRLGINLTCEPEFPDANLYM
ncbi:MAG: DUF1846 domain-containing protein [Clostridia bacterium]|nr:DUF1846 domain-containing protein [Clostridia bacterium]